MITDKLFSPHSSGPIDWRLIGSEVAIFGQVADTILEVSGAELIDIARDMAASPSGRKVIAGLSENAETMRMLANWFADAERRLLDQLALTKI